MSALEGYAQPILTPLIHSALDAPALTPIAQCTLAMWTTLRSMVFDATEGIEKHYYTQLERVTFSLSNPLAPPPNTRVWLAPHGGKPLGAQFKVINDLNVTENMGLHSMTVVMNQIAIQLVTWKGEGRALNLGALRRDRWDSVTKQIWPGRRRDIPWPPPQYLTDSSLKTFFDRFKRRMHAT
jgi:hypothetical protein